MRAMPRVRWMLLATAIVLLPSAALAASVTEIVSQVSQSSYTTYLNQHLFTHTGDNRGITGSQHDIARTAIYDAFQSFGLATSLEAFTYNAGTYYNVVGVLPGKVHPNQIYIIGAHYDSVNNPGADDNASGVAGVLEAARTLSQHQFDSTVVFVGFDREEQGLYGSTAYAIGHQTDDIRGMISMDMIAYNPVGSLHDQAYVYYASATAPALATDLATAMLAYGQGLMPSVARLASASSDHYPFYSRGFEAALLIEKGAWSNPNYHKAADSVDTPNYIDYAYATNMTRSVVGYLATKAVAIPEPSTLLLLGLGGLLLGTVVGGRLMFAKLLSRG